MSNYQVILFDEWGTAIDVVTDFSELSYARSLNTVGNLSLTIPGFVDFNRDYRIQVWRSIDDGDLYLEGNTIWFVNSVNHIWSNGSWNTSVTASDALYILRRILVAYTRDTVTSDKTVPNGNNEAADDMIKTYAAENFGSGATDLVGSIDRELPISIDGDRTVAPVTEKQGAWRSLLDLFKDICSTSEQNGTSLYFDIVFDPVDDSMTLKTFVDFIGEDRGELFFGPDFGNVEENFSVGIDWKKEVSRIYNGGDGTGSGRTIQIEDYGDFVGPFGRVEYFFDQRDIGDTSVLTEESDGEYSRLKSRYLASGSAVDTEASKYGRDFYYGDKVRISANGIVTDAIVKSISITVSNGYEQTKNIIIESL